MITDAEVRAVYKTAPQNLKEYVDSDEVFNAFHEIRAAYNLHVDHAGNLATVINAVVLGMRPFTDMPALLEEAMQGLDAATRDKVLKDVNDKIFVPLRAITKKHAEEVDAARAAREPVRAAEVKLAAAPPVVARPPEPAPVQQVSGATQQAQPVATEPTPLSTPVMSVVEQKLGSASTVAAPQERTPTPAAPPKYHGADPYKEPIE